MTTQLPSHPIRTHLAAYGFFLAVALLITWPLLTVLSTSFAGYPFGDAHEMTRHIWWFKYALQHGQPLIFQPLLGYPDGFPGVILWSDPLQFFPAWLLAFFMPLPAAYNVQCLLNLALNGWAAYFLMWKLLGAERIKTQVSRTETLTETHTVIALSPPSRRAALLAGIVFMTAPVIQGHLAGGHGGLLLQWPLPLLAWALIQLRTDAGARHVVPLRRIFPAVLFFVLLPFGHTLQLIYAGMPLIAVFGLTLLVRREWRALGRLIGVVILGGFILFLFLIPVFGSTFGTSAYTDEGGGVAFSIDLLGIVTPSFNHPLFGQLEYTHSVLGVNIVEGSSYLGIIAGLLALVALWKKPAARWWLLLGAVAWVLALGPLLKIFDTPVQLRNGEYSTFVTLPWSLVADLPGFNLARTPGRFGFVMALAVAVMAGYGAAWIRSKLPDASDQSPEENAIPHNRLSRYARARHVVPLQFVALAIIVLDYQSFWPLPTYSAEIPQAVHDLAAREDVRAVFDVPWENVLAAKDALWLQTAHEKPMIAGQVTRKTPVSPAKLTILEQTFDPALLKDAGVDVVIVHKQYSADDTLPIARQKLGGPFYEDAQLALFDVPQPTELAQFVKLRTSNEPLGTLDALTYYYYVPQPGWIRFAIDDHSSFHRPPTLRLDGEAIKIQPGLNYGVAYTDVVTPGLPVQLFVDSAGYHTLTITLDPPCPGYFDSSLQCKGMTYFETSAAAAEPFIPGHPFAAVQFDRGVTLRAAFMPSAMRNSATPSELTEDARWVLSLWWQFDQPITDQDIRFIKLLDEQGNQVEGYDNKLGTQAAGDQQLDSFDPNFGKNLAPGTYRICVGWYSYPDLKRFAVLSDVDGAQDGMACISQFTVPASNP